MEHPRKGRGAIMSDQIKQVAEALKAAREAYIAIADVTPIAIPKAAKMMCLAGEYDDDPKIQILAAAIQAAEVRGYERAVDDAVSICLEKSDSDSRDVDVMMQAAAISDCADAILALKKGGE